MKSSCFFIIVLPTLAVINAFFAFVGTAGAVEPGENERRIDLSGWRLVWEDDFDYPNERLGENWESQNGPSRHILCSRWRENAVVKKGILHLINKKEQRAGQDWTSASIWTKRRFKYGYFECRYRYAEATGTNNSFWLMTKGPEPKVGKRFEIDINEGHYPNEINTNVHNHTDVVTRSDGTKTHDFSHKGFAFGNHHGYSLPLEIPVETKRLRFSSTTSPHFHIREFRIYRPNKKYPDPFSESADDDIEGLVNHARAENVQITCSGTYDDRTTANDAADGTIRTCWTSQDDDEKWLEFLWPESIKIGCIQFVNGWKKEGEWTGWGEVNNYKVQAHDGLQWKDIAVMKAKDGIDFGAEFHTYGLLWTENELVYYLDNKEIRRIENEFCHSESPIWLSEAIITWAGTVSDEIDGTSMKVDWVRYYQKKEKD